MSKRYFIDRDESGHAYLVNADSRDEWNRWVDLGDSPDGWDTPPYAERLGYHPAWVEFENPKRHRAFTGGSKDE